MKKTKATPRTRTATVTSTTKSSMLHPSLTTVTPFSKYLAMFLFVILPFLGFYMGMKFQRKMTWMMGPGACLELQETGKFERFGNMMKY